MEGRAELRCRTCSCSFRALSCTMMQLTPWQSYHVDAYRTFDYTVFGLLPSSQGRLLSSPPVSAGSAEVRERERGEHKKRKWKWLRKTMMNKELQVHTLRWFQMHSLNHKHSWMSSRTRHIPRKAPVLMQDNHWRSSPRVASGVATTPWSFTDWSPNVRAIQSPG